MIYFCIIVSKQGRIRLRRNFDCIDGKERLEQESSVISKCLSRLPKQCSFFYHDNMSIVYRRFTALCFICGVSKDENELAIQELLNVFMNCLGAYFPNVTELDIVHNIEKVYMILDEIIVNGSIAYTSKERALLPLQLLEAGS